MSTASAQPFEARRKKLINQLGQRVAVIFAGRARERNIPSIRYPFRASSHFLFFCGPFPEGSVLILSREGSELFLETTPEDDAIWHGVSRDDAQVARDRGIERVNFRGTLGQRVKQLGIPAFAPFPDLKSEDETQQIFGSPTPVDSDLVEMLIELRLVQDPFALGEIRRAIEVTGTALKRSLPLIIPGGSELAVKTKIAQTFSEEQMESSFPSIVTIEGEILHRAESDNILREGDLLLIDCGAETSYGYASDITRVYPVSGEFLPEQRDLYDLVKSVQAVSIDTVHPGARFRDVHLVACRKLAEGLVALGILRGDPDSLVERGAHAIFFPHGIGHLLGLDVHDMEDLGDRAGYAPGYKRSEKFGERYLRLDRNLRTGMVVTIEPGFYLNPAILNSPSLTDHLADCLCREVIAKFSAVRGIRLEDDVLVTDEGREILSSSIPELIA